MKRAFQFVAGLSILLCAAVLSAVMAARSDWFREKVRHRIVWAVEFATGGRTEIGAFHYDWKSLTVELDDFVLHGTESAAAPPFFQAKKIVVGLSIVSTWKRDIDVSSLTVDRPQLFLTFDASGNSNIPMPKFGEVTLKQAVDELLRFKVKRYQFNNGAIQTAAQFFPIDARGENLQLALNYKPKERSYGARLTSRQFQVTSSRFRPFAAEIDADMELASNRVIVNRLKAQSPHSTLDARGSLRDFENPVADVQLQAKLAAADLAYLLNIRSLRAGDLNFTGTAHHDPRTLFKISGLLRGENLGAEIEGRRIEGASVETGFEATSDGAEFRQLKLAVLGARLTGTATLESRGDFSVAGELEGANLRRFASFVRKESPAWDGVLSGPLRIRGKIQNPESLLEASANLRIQPASEGIPVAGKLDVTYRANGNGIEFGNSQIDLPQTHITLFGPLAGDLQIALDSTNLDDIKPVLPVQLLVALEKGSSHFDGVLSQAQSNPHLDGNVVLRNFTLEGRRYDFLRGHIQLGADKFSFAGLSIGSGDLQATADGQVSLADWRLDQNGPLRLKAKFKGVDVAPLARQFLSVDTPFILGIASGSAELSGSLTNPHGTGSIHLDNADAYGEKLNQIEMSASLTGNRLEVARGKVEAGPALLQFSGSYLHDHNLWRQGELRLKLDSNGFPISSIATVRRYDPGLAAKIQLHGEGAVKITPGHIEPIDANGNLSLTNVTQDGSPYGSFAITAQTKGQELDAAVSGDLRESQVRGQARVQLTPQNPTTGEFHVGRMQLTTLYALIQPAQNANIPLSGALSGDIRFSGPLQQPLQMQAKAEINELTINSSSSNLSFHNVQPIVLAVSDGVASVQSFQVAGPDTTLSIGGAFPFRSGRAMALKAEGTVDMRAISLFIPETQTAGQAVLSAAIGGTPADPLVQGNLQIRNGSLFINNFPSGLTDMNGTVAFDRGRAVIQRLTGQSGGGQIALTGFMSYHAGAPLVYNLAANAQNVRFRYGGAVSVTANSELKLTGTSAASVLSGDVAVAKIAFNPTADVGNILAAVSAPVPSPSNQKDFVSGLQLDVHLESAPDLQLSTALSRDLSAEIDLRLRGRPDHPSLLGAITASQGDIRIFGTKYSINRGEVNFVNPAKIEPVLDLDLQTEARGITVDITVAGPVNKLNINYRSDPPLQPRDIIALLTVGRAPDIASSVPNAQVTNDASNLQAGANTVLGQAISPVSNRLSKLFGITNIKIDPLVQGITNTPQARLTVEQQISRDVTVTYITNLQETSEQIFRFEWAINSQYSLVALRDDNGEFGMDIQYKKRFK